MSAPEDFCSSRTEHVARRSQIGIETIVWHALIAISRYKAIQIMSHKVHIGHFCTDSMN
jgi:hypothetical protein